MDELKPCPFCGGEAEHIRIFARQHVVRCADQCAEWLHVVEASQDKAIAIWNTRAASEQAEPSDPVKPNPDEVICPACAHQFRAIPEAVQSLMLGAGFKPPFIDPPMRAEPSDEPIATVVDNNQPGWHNIVETAPNVTLPVGTKLYPRPAKPLTEEQIDEIERLQAQIKEMALQSISDSGQWIAEIKRLQDENRRLRASTGKEGTP